MSLDLIVSALDLNRLRLLAGSRDREKLRFILERQSDEISFHDEYFRKHLPSDPYLPLAAAIEQVIDGTIDAKAVPRFQFEHAVASMVDALGEPLDADLFLETDPSYLDEVDFVIRTKLGDAGLSAGVWPDLKTVLSRGPYLDVPLDAKFRLGTGYVLSSEVGPALQAANSVQLEGTRRLGGLKWPDEAVDGARAYREWLREAAGKQFGLFFHL